MPDRLPPRLVGQYAVHQILIALAGSHGQERFGLIAEGISGAANSDPLFPRDLGGSEATACVLVAIAWEGSRLQPYTRSVDHRYGLYRIRPPNYPRTSMSLYQHPRSCSSVAVDLVRESLRRSTRLPPGERLAWFLELGDGIGAPPEIMLTPREISADRSRAILTHAAKIYRDRFDGFSLPFEVIGAPRLDTGSVVEIAP